MTKKTNGQDTVEQAASTASVELTEEDLDQARGAGISVASRSKVSKAKPKTAVVESRIRSNLAVP